MILSSNKIHSGDILVLAYPDCPGKWPLNKCFAGNGDGVQGYKDEKEKV